MLSQIDDLNHHVRSAEGECSHGTQIGFLWGAGSSAYQTEGAWDEDGKGLSIWDEFCHSAGKIKNKETGDLAADAYHRLETDLALIKELGLNSYRFSVSWPRILPEGRGAVNGKGLAWYDRLVDGLLAAGIEPLVTLYHWDLPLALEREGGWENRNTAGAFAEYSALIAHHFDGRVKRYITLNEPQCFIGLGYGSGTHAPGKRLPGRSVAQCIHHALLAHGAAVANMRAACASPLEIGLASTGNLFFPASDSAAAEEAAYEETFTLLEDDWIFSHKWLLDASASGRYPEDIVAFRRLNDAVSGADLRMIREPVDFIGLNVYHGIPVDTFGNRVEFPSGFPHTEMKWPVTPECMYYGLRFLYERYGLPLIVTENGCSCDDRVFPDGAVHDAGRIGFLSQYLEQVKRAAESGVPVNGYFHWSLTDNFEWDYGCGQRFGLIYIDYGTQKRIIKDSGHWYRDVIKNNGVV